MWPYHQYHLKEVGGDTHQDLDLSEQIEIQRRHAVVIRDAGEEIHQDELAIAFSAISWFLVRRGFLLCSTFDDDDSGGATSSNS